MSKSKVARGSSSRAAAPFEDDTGRVQSEERRSFLRSGAALAGAAVASAAGVGAAGAQRLEIPP